MQCNCIYIYIGVGPELVTIVFFPHENRNFRSYTVFRQPKYNWSILCIAGVFHLILAVCDSWDAHLY